MKLQRILTATGLTATIALSSNPAVAAISVGDHFMLSGFGTLGAVKTNTDLAEFMRDGQKSGATTEASFNVDSNFGLQLTGRANSWLSATVQVLGMQRDRRKHLDGQFEWAFLKVEPVEGLTVRLGRTAPAMFAVSDSRNVGYANVWLRAPNEVYGLALLHKLDGGDISYRYEIGSTALTASVSAGQSSAFAPGAAVPLPAENVRGINLQWEADGLTVRAGRTTTDIAITAGAGGGFDKYTFTGFGVLFDRYNVVAQAEVVRRDSSRYARFINAKGYYLLGGYRFGRLVPYASTARTEPGVTGGLAGRQKTNAVGTRWDAFSSAALKLQVERIDTDNTVGVSFITPTLPTGRGSYPVSAPVTAVSATIDFVF